MRSDLCAACYHVCHWNAGFSATVVTSTLGPQGRHKGVSDQSITFLFHRFKALVKWGFHLQSISVSLSLWFGFILCCRRLAGRGDGFILCSHAESSLADCHGAHFQLSSSLSAPSLYMCSIGVTSPSDNIMWQLSQKCLLETTIQPFQECTQSTWFHVD